MSGPRLARVAFSPEILIGLTRGKFEVVARAAPEGAVVRNCGYDQEIDAVYITIEHPSFAEVEPGEKILYLEQPQIRLLDT